MRRSAHSGRYAAASVRMPQLRSSRQVHSSPPLEKKDEVKRTLPILKARGTAHDSVFTNWKVSNKGS